MTMRMFTLILNSIFIRAQRLWGKWLWTRFGFAIDNLALIAFSQPTRSGCKAIKCPIKAHLPYINWNLDTGAPRELKWVPTIHLKGQRAQTKVHTTSFVTFLPWNRVEDCLKGEELGKNAPCHFICQGTPTNVEGILAFPRWNSNSYSIDTITHHVTRMCCFVTRWTYFYHNIPFLLSI